MSCRAKGYVHTSKKRKAPIPEQMPEVKPQDDGNMFDLDDIIDQEKICL